MSTALPMSDEHREAVYGRQTRRETPKQRRRREKKAARAAVRAVLAGGA